MLLVKTNSPYFIMGLVWRATKFAAKYNGVTLEQGCPNFFQEGQIDNVKVTEGQERSLKKRSLLRFHFKFRYISPRIVVISKKKKKGLHLDYSICCRNVAPLQAVAGHHTLSGQNTLCFSDRSEKRACLKKL